MVATEIRPSFVVTLMPLIKIADNDKHPIPYNRDKTKTGRFMVPIIKNDVASATSARPHGMALTKPICRA